MWVGNNSTAQQHILTALHASGIRGHSGITATYARVKHLFAWPGMKTLPPRRSANHRIPLVPGAQPVKVRPYKYSLIQKT